MKPITRIFVATILAPLAICPTVLITLIPLLLQVASEQEILSGLNEWIQFGSMVAAYGMFFGWPTLIAAGLPVYLLLRSLGLASIWLVATFGAVIGAAFGFWLMGIPDALWLLITTSCGAAVAALFARIANGPSEPESPSI